MKIAIWTNYPNHYQSAFHRALREANVDLCVRYYDPLPPERLAMGWGGEKQLPADDRVVDQSESLDQMLTATARPSSHLAGLRRGVPFEPVQDARARAGDVGALVRAIATGLATHRELGDQALVCAAGESARDRRVRHRQCSVARFSRGGGFGRISRSCCRIRCPCIRTIPCPITNALNFAIRDLRLVSSVAVIIARRWTSWFARLHSSTILVAVLTLVGSGMPYGEHWTLAKELGVVDRVLFRGSTTPDGIPHMIASFDVAMLPSRFDGWGVALNEAALMGKPLIASDRVGAAEHLIEHGRNGFIVCARKREVAGGCDAAIPGESVLAREHGQRSREIATDFTPQRNVQRFVHAIESCARLLGLRLNERQYSNRPSPCPLPEYRERVLHLWSSCARMETIRSAAFPSHNGGTRGSRVSPLMIAR